MIQQNPSPPGSGNGKYDGGAGDARGGGRPSSSPQSFVWTSDTAGRGWCVNEDLGGMRGYKAMHATKPGFFIHSGDTIYADGPIAASVTEKDGQVWRNRAQAHVLRLGRIIPADADT